MQANRLETDTAVSPSSVLGRFSASPKSGLCLGKYDNQTETNFDMGHDRTRAISTKHTRNLIFAVVLH